MAVNTRTGRAAAADVVACRSSSPSSPRRRRRRRACSRGRPRPRRGPGCASCSASTSCSWSPARSPFPTRSTNDRSTRPRAGPRRRATPLRSMRGSLPRPLAVAAVYVRAIWFTPRRGHPGARAEDLLPARAGGAHRLHRVRRRRRSRRCVYLWLRDPRARSRGRELGRGRTAVHDRRARHRADLGQADLGHVVDVGRAAHAHALPLVRLRRLSRAARRDRGAGDARALLGGARHPRRAARSRSSTSACTCSARCTRCRSC